MPGSKSRKRKNKNKSPPVAKEVQKKRKRAQSSVRDGFDEDDVPLAEDSLSELEVDARFDKDAESDELTSTSGVVLLQNIPFGFFENEMRGYFGQFGDVLRLRLIRNPYVGTL